MLDLRMENNILDKNMSAERNKIIEKNFDALFNAAASGTDNSLSEIYADLLDKKTNSLTKAAKAANSGVDLTAEEKKQIHANAKEWVTTAGLKQLKNTVMGREEKDNIKQAEEFFEVYTTYENNGLIAALIKFATKSKDWVSSLIESAKSDESFDEIYAKKKLETGLKEFAEHHKLDKNQFLAEINTPPAESIAIQPKRIPPEAQTAALHAGQPAKNAGASNPVPTPEGENKSPQPPVSEQGKAAQGNSR